jgi:hypothetical protein
MFNLQDLLEIHPQGELHDSSYAPGPQICPLGTVCEILLAASPEKATCFSEHGQEHGQNEKAPDVRRF